MADATSATEKPLRVVIDTNQLAGEQLKAFLSASPDNRAVLPDYVAMERFKPDDLQRLRNGFSVLKPFADQVVILKGTGAVSRLNPDVETLPQALIDLDQTEAFADFCYQLDRAVEGDESVLRQLRERADWAEAQMSAVLAGSSNFSRDLAEFEQFFSKADLTHIRQGRMLTPQMNAKFDTAVSTIAYSVFRNAPAALAYPSPANWPNHFILRNALCNCVYMLSFIRRGIGARKPEKARNDVVDVLLATYGTYFNGVMSHDNLTNEVHHVARYILETEGIALPVDYLKVLSRTVGTTD